MSIVSHPSATDRFMAAIEKHQAEHPELSYVQASDAVHKAMPALHAALTHEARYPHLRSLPMTKQADPRWTPEAVLKTARGLAADNKTWPREEFLNLLKAADGTPHLPVVAEAWRRYLTSDQGVDDWYAERLAPKAGK